jgi:predicted MFS family arabinose efflux permease
MRRRWSRKGFGLAETFWSVTILGPVATVARWLLVRPVAGHGGGNLRGEIAALRNLQVWVALGTTMLGFVASA